MTSKPPVCRLPCQRHQGLLAHGDEHLTRRRLGWLSEAHQRLRCDPSHWGLEWQGFDVICGEAVACRVRPVLEMPQAAVPDEATMDRRQRRDAGRVSCGPQS